MTQEQVGSFTCPKGCGRADFKTKAASYAHAVWCKFQPAPAGGDGAAPVDNPMAALEANLLSHMEQGMAALEQRVMATLPQLVAKHTDATLQTIIAGAKPNHSNNPQTSAGATSTTPSTANLMQFLNMANTFLATPLGKIVEQRFLGRRRSSSVSMRGLSRGMSTATRMMLSKKTDMESMATLIKDAADQELKDRKLDTETRDFVIGMRSAAQLVLGGKGSGAEKAQKGGEGQ